MEQGLTDWNQRLAHVLVEASPNALVAVAHDTRVLFWNQGAHDIFGYTREEATGRSLFDLIVPPDRVEEARRGLAETIKSGSASGESVRRRKDGALVYVDVTRQVVRDKSGNVDYIVLSHRDVTPIRSLHESEERYRLVAEHIQDAILLLDLESRVTFTNRRGEELTGYSGSESRNLPLATFLTPEGAIEAARRIDAATSGRDMDPFFETELVRRDGSKIWVEANVTNVLKDGRVVGRMVVASDITARRQAEIAFRKSSQTLQALIDAAPVTIYALDTLAQHLHGPCRQRSARLPQGRRHAPHDGRAHGRVDGLHLRRADPGHRGQGAVRRRAAGPRDRAGAALPGRHHHPRRADHGPVAQGDREAAALRGGHPGRREVGDLHRPQHLPRLLGRRPDRGPRPRTRRGPVPDLTLFA